MRPAKTESGKQGCSCVVGLLTALCRCSGRLSFATLRLSSDFLLLCVFRTDPVVLLLLSVKRNPQYSLLYPLCTSIADHWELVGKASLARNLRSERRQQRVLLFSNICRHYCHEAVTIRFQASILHAQSTPKHARTRPG